MGMAKVTLVTRTTRKFLEAIFKKKNTANILFTSKVTRRSTSQSWFRQMKGEAEKIESLYCSEKYVCRNK